MRTSVRCQELGVSRRHSRESGNPASMDARLRGHDRSRVILRGLELVFFLVTCHLSLVTAAIAATHVTGSYDLGASPRVMATVGGTPEYGMVFAQRNKAVTYGGVEYGPSIVKGYLNASGQLNDGAGNLWLDLIPNAGSVPSDSYYVVTINIQGRVHAEIWVVPDVATVAAEAVRQVQPPGATGNALDLANATGLLGLAHGGTNQSGWTAARCVRVNNAGNALESAAADCGTGGGSAPLASPTVSGTVKIDTTAADPVVYLKTSADTLLAGKASSVHTHSESDVTSLTTDLAGKVPTTRNIATASPLAGGGALSTDLTLSCPTCEVTGNKNAASGYAGLTAASKLNAAQGQEVWSATDLTDYSATSGSGATALKATISAPADAQCLVWNAGSSNWVNGSCAGGSSNHNLLSATHPDTVTASPLLGGLIYANSTPAWQQLSGNTTTTKKFLTQTGNGSVSAAPGWNTIASGDLPSAVVLNNQANTYTAGQKQTFQNSATTAGLNLASSADPSSPAQGDLWINTSDLKFRGASATQTVERQANKDVASGYAGLTASTKLNAAQGQEVWSVTDLTDYAGTSGSGSTAIKSTITSPATSDILTWNGSNWINQAPSGGSNHNLLSTTHPDTDAASVVLGDLLTGNSTPHWQRIAGNVTTTKKFLSQTGNGSVSALPSWLQPASSDLSDGSSLVKNNASNTWSTGTQDLSGATATLPVKAGTTAGAPATCTANKELYIKTDASPAGQQVFICNGTGNGWNLVGDGGGAGGGDNITVNSAAVSDANFNDSTPAAESGYINVKWQKDVSSPANISAEIPLATSSVAGAVSTTAQTLAGIKTFNNDLQISTDGSSTTTPRVGAFVNLSSGEAARFQFGDPANAFQLRYAGRMQIYSYWGLELLGSRQTAEPSFVLGDVSDPGVSILNTVAAVPALAVKGAASQSGDLTTWQDSAATTKAQVKSDGAINSAVGYQVAGAAPSGQILIGNGTNYVPSNFVRSITYIAGGDNASAVLTDADDQAGFWVNDLDRTYRITRVWVQSDGGTPSINLQRDDGSAANILSSNLSAATGNGACADSSGSSMTIRGTSITCSNTIASGERDVTLGNAINFVMATAGGTAKRVTVNIQLVAQ